MTNTFTRKRVLAACTAAAVCGASATALSAIGSDSTEPKGSSPAIAAVSEVPQTMYSDGSTGPLATLDKDPPASDRTTPAQATAQIRAFAVLSRSRPVTAANDPLLQQMAAHDPDIVLPRVRPLDSGGQYWLMPKKNGDICFGRKSNGPAYFSEACGPLGTATTTGMSFTVDDTVVALVPDGVDSVTTTDGSTIAVKDNVFEHHGLTHVSFVRGGKRYQL